jgi:molybdopterin-synthase adenylyltransferase
MSSCSGSSGPGAPHTSSRMNAELNDEALLRYSRHILLPELGIDAQTAFANAHALIIGAGGLGSPVALYLAAAGVGTLTLCDHDEVDLTNLQRQIAHDMRTLGMPKVLSAQRRIAEMNPLVQVRPVQRKVQGADLDALVADADIVLDCCDNFATRHAVNRACVKHRKPLVSGAAIRFDGQVCVYDSRSETSPCYHCLFPEGDAPEEVRCAVMGVFAPITGIVGTIQANEALKVMAGIGESLTGRLLTIDAMSMAFQEIRIPRDAACTVCAKP